MAHGSPVSQSCVHGGIISIAHHRRSTQSTAASDSWIRTVRANGSHVIRPPSESAQLVSELGSFSWVGKLPCAGSLRIAFCLKGLSCSASAANLARQIAPAELHSCVEEPGGRTNGTEGVCAFRFLMDNYPQKKERQDWPGVYFAHDDIALNHGAHTASYNALRTFLGSSNGEWPRWPASPYDVTAKECGCLVIRERGFDSRYYWWRPMCAAPPPSHMREPTPSRCYGGRRWWIESFLGSEGERLVAEERIHWPLAFMFAIDKHTVMRHSRSYYAAMHRLARQGVKLLHGIKVGPGSLGDGFEMVYNPDTFGHALERLPFLVFANRSIDAPKPYALCRPHCSSEAGRVVSPHQLVVIERKLNALNRRKIFPASAPLPNREENLVLIRARNATRRV